MRLAKAHAYGNDFLYVERAAAGDAPLDLLARELCARHTGVGADGLIVYARTPTGASMALYNADGGRAEVSGNGVRGLAALLDAPGELTIETDAGFKQLTRVGRNGTRQTFRAAMGLPREVRQVAIPLDDETVEAVALDIGNPQCVVLGPLPDAHRFGRLGPAIERHRMFPTGTNVAFAFVESPAIVRVMIWERGVGPTQSSGTGSCGALVAAASFAGAAPVADVVAPGGAQQVEWLEDSVYLTGWAEVIVEGDWLRQIPRPT
jgi:diaminopimelate epimerase